MALTDESGSNMIMPVAPLNNGGGFGGFDGNSGWWIILLFILLGGWGNGGWGGGNIPMAVNTQNDVQRGFDQSAIMGGINDINAGICNGFSNVQQSLCNGFAGVNATVNSGFANAEVANNARQIANMQQAFAAQTAVTAGMNDIAAGLQNCCCENRASIADLKYTVASENCADRTAAYQNTRDIIDSQTRGTQAILDKLCQLELDGVKAQVDAKNDRISELQTQLNMANLAASQQAQNAFIANGFANEVDQLYNRLNNCPVPTTPVYGRTPIFTCNQNQCGCGCGMG